MAASIFIRIAGIKGESVDQKHKDEIGVLSWGWSVSQSGSTGHGGGAGQGKAAFQDLTFSHQIDKASPLLMKACATGQHLADAMLTQRRDGTAQHEFLVVKMTDVIVAAVSNGGSDEGPATFESVALAFAKADVEYRPQKSDGSLDAGIHFRYDLKANKEG
ncbi:MAG: Hcp family type VI secretion system effector [Chloroflexota bacterium]